MSTTVGLCAGCRHARIVQSRRGSRFWFCSRSRDDPRFPRYPQLPVLRCAGYEPGTPVAPADNPEEDPMSDEPIYTARAEIRKIEGVHRRARLEVGTEVEFGVHGPIRRHYRIDDRKNLPLPVDYIVAATGA